MLSEISFVRRSRLAADARTTRTAERKNMLPSTLYRAFGMERRDVRCAEPCKRPTATISTRKYAIFAAFALKREHGAGIR
jgi:hypothetical protein